MGLEVSDLMSTALITVRPKDTVERADLDMHLAGVRHFPVVDERNHLVGIISDRDLLRAFGLSQKHQVIVAEIMSTEVMTVDETASAASAVKMLIDHQIGCLPVIGDDGQLVGMVTKTDFLQFAHVQLADEDYDL